MSRSSVYVVGIDQGTAATRATQLHGDGEVVALCSLEHRQFYPQAGWVEHDARELLSSVEQCLDYAVGAAAVGLDSQGETVVAWNADTGEPICRAIVWQDNRTHATLDNLRNDGAEILTLARAGLPLDTYFSASKLRWILEHVPEARSLASKRRLRLGTTDAFFLDRLCGVYATDVTAASRTSLMNLATRNWDPELCRLFGVPIDLLPPIRPTVGEFGILKRLKIPLVASVSDQQAALFGHGCHAPGQVKITFGSGALALAVTGVEPKGRGGRGMLSTVAWQIGDAPTYALDGGVYNATSAMHWVRGLGLYQTDRELARFDGPSALERGLVFVPALSGLASPYWDHSAAGMWLGMGLHTEPRDLVRAALEGVALRSAQALAAMSTHIPLSTAVSIDGPLARSEYFCDFLARALDRTVLVPASPDLTSLGCAQLAYIGAGLAPIDALPAAGLPGRCASPVAPLSADHLARFDDAVSRARGWRSASH
ncbi:MAG: FGGY family carbohydrate kinase [Burkholderiales bacterium]